MEKLGDSAKLPKFLREMQAKIAAGELEEETYGCHLCRDSGWIMDESRGYATSKPCDCSKGERIARGTTEGGGGWNGRRDRYLAEQGKPRPEPNRRPFRQEDFKDDIPF